MKLIYSYTNLVNNKKYIGQTNNLKRRISQHKQDSSFNYCDSRYRQLIHQAIRKYGENNFKIDILEDGINDGDIDKKEKYYIELYNTVAPNGYNLTEGGLSNKTPTKKSRIDEKTYCDIIENLRSNISLREISEKFKISYSYLSDINNGTRLAHNAISYPIRKSSNCPEMSYYENIITALKTSELSQKEIAYLLKISKTTVQRVNCGNIKRLKEFYPDLTFPIRNK